MVVVGEDWVPGAPGATRQVSVVMMQTNSMLWFEVLLQLHGSKSGSLIYLTTLQESQCAVYTFLLKLTNVA